MPAARPLPALTVAAEGAYAARLAPARAPGAPAGAPAVWFPERWTLEGPEPYAVPLPLDQPEEPDSQVQPLADGRVLICRKVADRYAFSLLYPTGPGTGEVPLGAVACPRLTLLPPVPGGDLVYALAPGAHTTALWLVAGGAFGPELVTQVPGRCSGGAWLDRTGRLLALDREAGGVVKAVAVDLGRGGELSPLLQIAEDSDDRLLMADPDSGLLLIRSNAPGHDRVGWGVLGSMRPVRFPECLRLGGRVVTPFAVQPGQALTPETCAVAFRVDGAGGTCLGVWRPAGRRLHLLPPPPGWLAGAGLWTAEGVLRLPYATAAAPCAVAELPAPQDTPRDTPRDNPRDDPRNRPQDSPWDSSRDTLRHTPRRTPQEAAREDSAGEADAGGAGESGAGVDTPVSARETDVTTAPCGPTGAPLSATRAPNGEPHGTEHGPSPYRPVPLQQAPLRQQGAVGRASTSGQGAHG
ncbi:hypothetical protein LCE31_12620 [Streptomyces sp. 8L]|nr:hypothetical protein [Streptomyces sp. 8L]MCA1219239.1 hypothetical protein [Streptomyces sp. 8L]